MLVRVRDISQPVCADTPSCVQHTEAHAASSHARAHGLHRTCKQPGHLSESKLHIASLVRQCSVRVLQCESICVERWTLQLVHLGLNPGSPCATCVTFNSAVNFSVIQLPHS